MVSDTSAFGSSQLRTSAFKLARELASEVGEAAVVYYRPIDGHWFVRRASADAPPGLTIKTTVHPGQDRTDRTAKEDRTPDARALEESVPGNRPGGA